MSRPLGSWYRSGLIPCPWPGEVKRRLAKWCNDRCQGRGFVVIMHRDGQAPAMMQFAFEDEEDHALFSLTWC